MRFVVPQFIEHEAKVIGPLTFSQFIFVGMAGGACFVLYFMLPTSLFIVACIFLIGGALAMSFVKMNGRPLSVLLTSLLKFLIMPKMYIWKKNEMPITTIAREKGNPLPGEREDELPLKIAEKSKLKKLKTHVEIGVNDE